MKRFVTGLLSDFAARIVKEAALVCHIIVHEFRQIIADSGVLLFFIGAMIMYPIVYPYPLKNQLVREVPVAVVDEDNSASSRQLLRMIDATEQLKITVRRPSFYEMKKLFYTEEIRGIVVIPDGFGKNILKGRKAHIALYTDTSYFMIYKSVYGGVVQSVETMNAGVEIKKLLAGGMLVSQAVNARDPMPVVLVPLFNATGSYGSYLIPAVMILLLQQSLLIGIGMLGGSHREKKSVHYLMPKFIRKNGPFHAVIGKAVVYLPLYFLHTIYFFGVLANLYGYPQRSPYSELLLFVLPFLLSVIFLGQFLSTFFKTRESSVLVLLCTSIPFILFSGFSWPMESIPRWLYYPSCVIPTTMGVDGILKLSIMGGSFNEISSNWIFLWVLSAFYFFLAAYRFKKISRSREFSHLYD